MRIWNRILLAVLIVGLLGTMMPVAAATVSPNPGQWKVYWRFMSPKPRPDFNCPVPANAGANAQGCRDTPRRCAEAPLAWLIAYWLFGIVF